MSSNRFTEPIAQHVWNSKYRFSLPGGVSEPSVDATWDRVALAVSGAETHHRDEWRERFRLLQHDFRFLPGGRILANAVTQRHSTLFNCFVLGGMEDSVNGIFNTLRETMLTIHAGGGVGLDFSSLRPAGAAAMASGGVASGPLSFMRVWEEASAVMASNSNRRGDWPKTS